MVFAKRSRSARGACYMLHAGCIVSVSGVLFDEAHDPALRMIAVFLAFEDHLRRVSTMEQCELNDADLLVSKDKLIAASCLR
jgi:uncharacterized membrane protein